MPLCVHGHFYQPPREDPISNYIPDESGAEPFHNWNERILAECYEPNARMGNFGKISFNIGPTLFDWMWKFAPDVAERIIEQERANYLKYGIGNGMAQGYIHSILPLIPYRDKVTNVRWGIEDFTFRFGHRPQGLWLPEAAVDLETLCVLQDCGMEFTILAPWQVRPLETKPGPYYIELPGNRKAFIVFPYHRDLSTSVSFLPKSTENGDEFLSSIRFREGLDLASFNMIATDGELYGHHQKFRDHFLRYILNEGGQKHGIDWSWPGLWLLERQPEAYAILNELSSWSCMHGVNRWCLECSCTPGARWKKPFFEAMREISSWVDSVYETHVSQLVSDPWEVRDQLIQMKYGQKGLKEVCGECGSPDLDSISLTKIGTLLRAQYESLRMFTSCGWFFDEFHRIEPQNNIAYAAKAIWLTQKAAGEQIDPKIIEKLALVRSEKTGLRADTVLSQTLIRAENEQNGLSKQFN